MARLLLLCHDEHAMMRWCEPKLCSVTLRHHTCFFCPSFSNLIIYVFKKVDFFFGGPLSSGKGPVDGPFCERTSKRM